MKSFFLLVLVVVSGFCTGAVAQCGMSMNEDCGVMAAGEITNAVAGTAAAAGEEKIFVGNKICPVSGETIQMGTQAQVEYQGKVYNLCCPMCIDTFKQDPEKYIKILEEKEKAAAEAAATAVQK